MLRGFHEVSPRTASRWASKGLFAEHRRPGESCRSRMNDKTPCLSNMEKNDQQRGGQDLPAPICSASWKSPETAPRDGTPILGDFGWPWPNFAVWDEYDAQWCVATLQASPMEDGPTNSWIETDTERDDSLRRWMEMPILQNTR